MHPAATLQTLSEGSLRCGPLVRDGRGKIARSRRPTAVVTLARSMRLIAHRVVRLVLLVSVRIALRGGAGVKNISLWMRWRPIRVEAVSARGDGGELRAGGERPADGGKALEAGGAAAAVKIVQDEEDAKDDDKGEDEDGCA